jgi:hypothetical protein
MKPIAAIALIVLTATATAGEDPAEITGLLASPEPTQVARGAYRAGRGGVEAATPALLDALRPRPERTGESWRLAHRAVLDALVRLDAKPSLELVTPYLNHGKYGWMPLILLARLPESNGPVLMERFAAAFETRKSLRFETMVAGNLLCQAKAPGFAARLLSRLEMTLVLEVRNDDGCSGGHSDSFVLGGRGDCRTNLPDGFPPYAIYTLVFAPGRKPDVHLLADGPNPISWTREEQKGPKIGYGWRGSTYPREKAARQWLAVLAGGTHGRHEIPEETRASHRWEGPEVYAGWAARQRDGLILGYWRTVKRLVDRKVLTAEEAGKLEPSIAVEVLDEREDKGVALPEIPASELKARFGAK